jgi:hypothetical protein
MTAETPLPDMCGYLCLGFSVVLILIGLYAAISKADEKSELRRAREKLEADCRAREQLAWDEKKKREEEQALTAEAKLREDEVRRQQDEAEQAAQLALAQAIQKVRDAAEERYRTALASANLEEMDQRLREAQLIFSRGGRVLTVRVFISPTGWVGIEWMQDPGRPYPLKVVCWRGDEVITIDHLYRGVIGDILVRGRAYVFSFEAFDGKRNLEPDFQFEVKVPTVKQWKRKVDPAVPKPVVEDEATREQKLVQKAKQIVGDEVLWQKLRKDAHQAIDNSEGSDFEKRRKKGAVDTRLQEVRDKEEGKGK